MSDVVPAKANERAHNNGHVYRWITDRQPTALDANGAGAVRIRKYPNGSSSAAVHWSFIGPGVPWQHCNDWKEEAGDHHADDRYVDADGNEWRFDRAINGWELVASPFVNPETIVTRQFVSISRAFGPNGQHFIDAVASDGTAWYHHADHLNAPWYRHASLPVGDQ